MNDYNIKKGAFLRNGKYRIEKVLGRGSFGITYLATTRTIAQGELGKMEITVKVAVKEFFMSDINSRGADGTSVEGSSGNVFTNYRKKFRKEAENLAKLSHSNIVRVFDVFDENGTTYYVMEYLDGDNLDDYIKLRGHIPEAEAVSIIREIGAAIDYMHSCKMLHLDVKPKNVMRQRDAANKLIDFGLSKQYDEQGEPESSTSIGLGTPGYAPLEQSQYKQDGTFPATLDVYALGATMYKLLTGKRPPEATIIFNEGFPEKDLADLNVSPKTTAAVRKAMAPAKRDRYPSIMDFILDLGTAESGEEEDEATQFSLNGHDGPRIPEEGGEDSGYGFDVPTFNGGAGAIRITSDGEPIKAGVMNFIAATFKGRNIVTIVTQIIGILWFWHCIGYFAIEQYQFEGLALKAVSACFMVATIRLFLNRGNAMYLPPVFLAVVMAVRIWVHDYNFAAWGCICLLFPYALILLSMLFKKNGKTGFEVLRNPKMSFRKAREIWKERSGFVNFVLSSGTVITFLAGLYGLAGIGVETLSLNSTYYSWIWGLYLLLCGIGMIYTVMGHKAGCWILWTAVFLCYINREMLTDEIVGIAFVAALFVQAVLLFRKNGRAAISVME